MGMDRIRVLSSDNRCLISFSPRCRPTTKGVFEKQNPIQRYGDQKPAVLPDDLPGREYDQPCPMQVRLPPVDPPGMIPIRKPNETHQRSGEDRELISDKVL